MKILLAKTVQRPGWRESRRLSRGMLHGPAPVFAHMKIVATKHRRDGQPVGQIVWSKTQIRRKKTAMKCVSQRVPGVMQETKPIALNIA